MTTILASELSPYGARLRIASALKGLDLSFDPPPGGTGSAELKKIHPFGRIPVLMLDDAVLVESLALLEFLEDAYPDTPSLRPTDAVGRARARMIALLFDHNVIRALHGVFAQVRAPQPDATAAVAALDETAGELGKVAHFFDPKGPAVNGALSIADCAMAPFAFLIDALSKGFGVISPTQRDPRFRQWWADIAPVPEVAKVVAQMQVALAAMRASRSAQARG